MIFALATRASRPLRPAHIQTWSWGTRPEDIQITAQDNGDFAAPVYICERTGDAVLVTIDVGGAHVCVRGERHLRFGPGERIGVKINREHCFLFDGTTEQRIARS